MFSSKGSHALLTSINNLCKIQSCSFQTFRKLTIGISTSTKLLNQLFPRSECLSRQGEINHFIGGYIPFISIYEIELAERRATTSSFILKRRTTNLGMELLASEDNPLLSHPFRAS
uniref:Uncharacterized protein n=1 Tax=Picea glauca TaxID=3330 RepID=A0A117NJ72_PICGL|nr:hypothetical protein ABT39_MTgene954 [Picea glauca]QHR86375.1 hypothetical protein Q903MT_gene374 [Picea sitchensis]